MDGYRTQTWSEMAYSYVVSRDPVQIELIIEIFNDLCILIYDIHSLYLTENCREQVWIVAGPEFVSESGQFILVKKVLYGLKFSGVSFRSHLT